ncbi:MAG TPA: hypothetical protein VK508_15430 [Cyclobacteriaceae bacterium]|nr:hypothetical protein [Cyclobacteriaceae bacterium]
MHYDFGLGWREAGHGILVWVCRILLPSFLLCACQPENKKSEAVDQPHWEKLGPGGGGATFIPTFSYKTPEEFLLRCDMTGAYLTTDGGKRYHQVNFPNGSTAFAFDPHHPATIYMGSSSLNRSTDGGQTWEMLFPTQEDILGKEFKGDHGTFNFKVATRSIYNTESPAIHHIRVDPVKNNMLYFSMGKSFYFSIDNGTSFKRKDLGYPIDFIYANKGKPKDDVLIFTTNSIAHFDKAAGTIDEKPLPASLSPAFSFSAGTVKDSDEVVMYALHHDQSKSIQEEFGYTELWTSNDNGTNWKQIDDATINNDRFKIKPSYSMVSCPEFDAAHAYVVSNRYEEKDNDKRVHWYGALKTSDTGKTWQWVWKGGGGSGQYAVKDGVGVANLTDAWVEKAFGGEYIRLMDVGVSPFDGNVAVVTDWYRTMKTVDGGKQWSEVYSEEQADGSFNSRGLDVTTAYGVHFDPFDSSHVAISYTDIGYHHSFNGGKSWIRSAEGIPAEWQNTCYWMVFDPEVKNKVWSVWSSIHDFPRGKMTRSPQWKDRAHGGVAVSTDGGKTWKLSNEGMGDNSATTSIVLDPKSAAGNRILYATVYNKGVFKSTDDGKTWALKNNGIGKNISAFEITLTPNGTLFLVVSPVPVHKDGKPGTEFYPGALYKSTDGAETWTSVKVSDKSLIFPNGIEYDPQNPDRLYLACWSDITLGDLVGRAAAKTTSGNGVITSEGGIFKSEDNGTTWTQVFDRDIYVYDVTADPRHKGRLYCNTFNQAAYRSDDFGKTWNKLKDYDFHWGQRVIVDQNHSEKVYLTTFGSSIWRGFPVTVTDKKSNARNNAWGFVGAGGGGAMFHPAISPHNENLAFVSCDMTGSYVTENGGESWRMFNLLGGVDFYAFDPSDAKVIYANSSALFRSDDTGRTWNVVYPDSSQITGVISKGDHATNEIVTKDHKKRKVLALAVDPAKSEQLYAAMSVDNETGFYSSNDRGKSWTKETRLEDGAQKIFILPSSPAGNRTIYVAGKHTISVRVGQEWRVNKGPANVKRFTAVSGGYDQDQNKLFIYGISGKGYFNPDGDESGIHVSDDGGRSWQNRQSGLVSYKIPDAEMPEFRAVATSDNHPAVLYVSYNDLRIHKDTVCIGVAKSEDYGVTWKLSWQDRMAPDHLQIPSPNMKDGWLNERFGPSWGENPFSLGVDPKNPDICYGTDFGRTIKTSNGGQTWEQVYTNKSSSGWTSRGLEVTTSYQIAFDPFDGRHGFIATTDIGLMETTDGGISWNNATNKNGIPRAWENSTYWLVMDPKVKNKMWAAMSGTHDLPRPKMWRRKGITGFKGGIVTSEDGGKSWKPVSADIGEAAVTHILLDSTSDPSSRVLYACAFGKGVFKSSDGGKTWKKKNNGLPANEPFAWRLERRNTDGTLFLVIARRSDDGSIGNDNDGAVYRSADGGDSWVGVTLPARTNGPMSLKVDPANPGTLLLSAWGRDVKDPWSSDEGGGIFRSDDDGKSWTHALAADQHIHDITYDARTNVFYACGFNSSAYRSEDSGRSWQRIAGYNFKWGKRVDPDPNDPSKIFIITFGGGVWHGPAKGDPGAAEDIATGVLSYRR